MQPYENKNIMSATVKIKQGNKLSSEKEEEVKILDHKVNDMFEDDQRVDTGKRET